MWLRVRACVNCGLLLLLLLLLLLWLLLLSLLLRVRGRMVELLCTAAAVLRSREGGGTGHCGSAHHTAVEGEGGGKACVRDGTVRWCTGECTQHTRECRDKRQKERHR